MTTGAIERKGFGGRQTTAPRVELNDHRTPGAVSRTLVEQETVVRFDRTGAPAVLWTADINQARRWMARGYPVEPVSGGWRCRVPKRALTFRVLSASMLAAGSGPEDETGPEDDVDGEIARMMAEETEAGS